MASGGEQSYLAPLLTMAILPTMTLPPFNITNIVLAAAPLILVLFLMIARNWGGSKAGGAGWAAAALIAVVELFLVISGRSGARHPRTTQTR